MRKSDRFTTNRNREDCQVTKPEVWAAGTWRLRVIREGATEKEAFELDQGNVEPVRSSPGHSRISKGSRAERLSSSKLKSRFVSV